MNSSQPAAVDRRGLAVRTFLLTDIEGSTRLWQAHPDAMRTALASHDAILHAAIEAAGGTTVKSTGDGVLAVFDDAAAAVRAAVDAQRRLAASSWADLGPLRVRMAVNSGPVQPRGNDFFGPPLNQLARLLAIGHGGQILVTEASRLLFDQSDVREFDLADHGEHRLRDLDRPVRVHEVLAPDLPRDHPPLRSLEASHTNLPVQMTSFVGRERELVNLHELLASNRCVTLVGLGGTGKTRLMLRAAAELTPAYRDGVWLVELAPIADPALLPAEVCRALGVRPAPGQPALDALIDFLRAKTLLLAIDNCEHVIAAAAEFAEEVLQACPRVALLASSREPLGVAGEQILSVAPLPVPATGGAGPAARAVGTEELLRVDAVKLFVQRASAVAPGFQLSAANAAVVAEICRRLDGIPLALELAAARVNVLSVDDISRRLGDRFRLLTGGRRTASPRQQTLQAAMDWSWDLLGEPDRQLLRRMAVFSGGWTLDAAAALSAGFDVVTGDVDPALEVLDGLARLVDRSLVIVDHAATSTRYRVLETIRQYAMAQLLAAGEVDAARHAHLEVFRGLAHAEVGRLHGPDLLDVLARLDAELDNVRAALEWAFEAEIEAALDLVVTLRPYWALRSAGPEAIEWIERARVAIASLPTPDLAGAGSRDALVARVLGAAATASIEWETSASGIEWGEAAVRSARRSDSAVALADALYGLASAVSVTGTIAAARPIVDEFLSVAASIGDWWRVSHLQAAFAIVLARDDPGGAAAMLDAADDAAARAADPSEQAYVTLTRGWVAGLQGRLADAAARLTDAAERYRALGDWRFELIARSELAHAVRRTGDPLGSEPLYRETLVAWQHVGNRGAVANQLEAFAYIAVAKGEFTRAARLLGAAERLRETAGAALLPHERGELDPARDLLRAALGAAELAATWAAGRRLSVNTAVAEALGG